MVVQVTSYTCAVSLYNFTLAFFSVDLLTKTGLSYFTREAVGGIMLIVHCQLARLLVDREG